jgi:hypothetical protein
MRLPSCLLLALALVVPFSGRPAAGGELPEAGAILEDEAAPDLVVATGFLSNFVFYGVSYGRDVAMATLDYELPIDFPLVLSLWSATARSGTPYDEFDVLLSTYGEVAGFDAFLMFGAYFYEQFDANYELSLTLDRSLGFVDWNTFIAHDFVYGWYHETSLSKTFALSDALELVLAGGIAYQHDYNNEAGGAWNHSFARITLPVSVGERTRVEPYLEGLFVMKAVRDFQNDLLHGGVMVTVEF